MVLVDSCIWITAGRRTGDLLVKLALEALLEEDEVCLCGPVRLAVLGAVRREMRKTFDENFRLLHWLEDRASDWDDAIALAKLLKDQANLTLPWLDVMIATIALRSSVRLYTLDNHFTNISRLTNLKLYHPGPGGVYLPPERN